MHMTVLLYCFLDSYDQRAEARKALSQDQTWINNYIKKMLKMLVKQVHFCASFPLFYYCNFGKLHDLLVYMKLI